MAKKKKQYSSNPNSQNNSSLYNGIKLLKEYNFSTSDVDLPLWDDKEGLPIHEGDTFPTMEMQRRANINRTMDALISGDLAESLQNFIYTWPDLDPITNRRTSAIVASLPLFNTVMRTWELLLHSCLQGVEVKGENRPELWKAIDKVLSNIITNKFSCCDRLLTVYADGKRPIVKIYSDKNIYLCRNKNDEMIYCLTNVFSPADNEEEQYLEVISFMPDNTCLRDVYQYSRGKVGQHIVVGEAVDTQADVHFEKNGAGNGNYGQPILGGLIPATLGTIRAFSLLTLLCEKKREVIRIVPDSQIQTDQYTGASVYVQGGTVAYADNNAEIAAHNHDVQFIVPEMQIKEALDILDKMLQQLSIYSGLSGVILGYQTIGGNMSGQAIAESCLSTIINATGYLRDLKTELTHVVKEMLRITGEEVSSSDIKIIATKPSEALTDMLGINVSNEIQ